MSIKYDRHPLYAYGPIYARDEANFAGIIFRIIGMQKERAKCWHIRSKFEQNAVY